MANNNKIDNIMKEKRILELLKEGKINREIRKELKCGADLITKIKVKYGLLKNPKRMVRDFSTNVVNEGIDFSQDDEVKIVKAANTAAMYRNKKIFNESQVEDLQFLNDYINVKGSKNKATLVEEFVKIYNKNNTFVKHPTIKELKLEKDVVEIGFHSINYSKLLTQDKKVILEQFKQAFSNLIKLQVTHLKGDKLIVYLGLSIFGNEKLRESNSLKIKNMIKDITDFANMLNQFVSQFNQVFGNVEFVVVHNDVIDEENSYNDIAFDYNYLLGKFIQNAKVTFIDVADRGVVTSRGVTEKKGEVYDNTTFISTKGAVKFDSQLNEIFAGNVKDVISFGSTEKEFPNNGYREKTFSPNILNKLVYTSSMKTAFLTSVN